MLLDQTNSHCRTTHFWIMFTDLEEQIVDQNNLYPISPVHSAGVFILAQVQ